VKVLSYAVVGVLLQRGMAYIALGFSTKRTSDIHAGIVRQMGDASVLAALFFLIGGLVSRFATQADVGALVVLAADFALRRHRLRDATTNGPITGTNRRPSDG
jgi:NADH:ubiquinone oxidoreductase subunit 4 (subunit M)